MVSVSGKIFLVGLPFGWSLAVLRDELVMGGGGMVSGIATGVAVVVSMIKYN